MVRALGDRIKLQWVLVMLVALLLISAAVVTFSLTSASAADPWWDADWGYRTEITIDHTKVESNLTNFPVLVHLTENDLKSTGNGGHVGQSDGGDIAFVNGTGTQFDHEIEEYNPATGELIAWVEVPNLSGSVDTVLYAYYGNGGVADQENATGVWDSNFEAVYHQKGTSTNINDSTANNNDATKKAASEPAEASGKIGQGQDFDGSDDYASAALGATNAPFTVEAWGYFDLASQPSGNYDYIMMMGTGANMVSFSRNASDNRFYSYSNSAQKFGPVLSGQQWVHLVGVYDTSSAYHRLFINGVEVSVDDFSGAMNTNGNLSFGRYEPTNTHFMDGKVDEVRVSSSLRSADWIKTEYSNQNSPATFLSLNTEEAQPNTLAGSGVATVTVDLGSNIAVSFSDVTDDGNTTVVEGAPGQSPPGGFSFYGNQFDISTTAGYSSPVLVTIPYNEGSISGDESDLKIFHWNGSSWDNVTVSVNTGANTITGQASSLSPWVVGGASPEPAPVPASSAAMLFGTVVLGLAIIVRRYLTQRA